MPEPDPASGGSQNKKHDTFEWVGLVVGIFTLIAVGTYTALQIYQTNLFRANNIASQRAYVFLRDIDLEARNDNIFDMIPQWENTGNSQTVGMHGYISRYIGPIDMPSGFSYGDINNINNPPMLLGPKNVNTISFDRIDRSCLTQFNRRDDMRNFYIWGWAKYSDTVSSEPHVTRFCWKVDQVIFSHLSERVRLSHALCDEGNCADKECKEPEQSQKIAIQSVICKPEPIAQPTAETSPAASSPEPPTPAPQKPAVTAKRPK